MPSKKTGPDQDTDGYRPAAINIYLEVWHIILLVNNQEHEADLSEDKTGTKTYTFMLHVAHTVWHREPFLSLTLVHL